MTRIKLIDFQSMEPGTYKAVRSVATTSYGADGEVVLEIDESKLKTAFRQQFDKFVQENPDKILSTEQPVDELWTEHQKDAQRAEEKAIQAGREKRDNEAAAVRLTYWIEQRGVLNPAVVIAEVDKIHGERPVERMSSAMVDEAVNRANLAGAIQWKTETPAPPPPPPRVLEDGNPEMPLTATPNNRWSLVQLQDWDRRTREENAKQVRAANNAVRAAYDAAHVMGAL